MAKFAPGEHIVGRSTSQQERKLAPGQAFIDEEKSTITSCGVSAHWAVRGVPASGAGCLSGEGDAEFEAPAGQLMAFTSINQNDRHLLRAFAQQCAHGAGCLRCIIKLSSLSRCKTNLQLGLEACVIGYRLLCSNSGSLPAAWRAEEPHHILHGKVA